MLGFAICINLFAFSIYGRKKYMNSIGDMLSVSGNLPIIPSFGAVIYEDMSLNLIRQTSVFPYYSVLGSFYLTYYAYSIMNPFSWMYFSGSILLDLFLINRIGFYLLKYIINENSFIAIKL